jgi:hypothetical protein
MDEGPISIDFGRRYHDAEVLFLGSAKLRDEALADG